MKEEMLIKLHEDGLLPEKHFDEWKAPGNHRVPERGLGLHASDFFHGLLHYYNIHMNHLSPNSILELLIFVHLCEAFLGIPPSIRLFWYFFKLKPNPDATNPDVVGGPGF